MRDLWLSSEFYIGWGANFALNGWLDMTKLSHALLQLRNTPELIVTQGDLLPNVYLAGSSRTSCRDSPQNKSQGSEVDVAFLNLMSF